MSMPILMKRHPTHVDPDELSLIGAALVVERHDHQSQSRRELRLGRVHRNDGGRVFRSRRNGDETALADRARPGVVLRRAGDHLLPAVEEKIETYRMVSEARVCRLRKARLAAPAKLRSEHRELHSRAVRRSRGKARAARSARARTEHETSHQAVDAARLNKIGR